MKCPYCDTDMVAGTLYGDDYKMKWRAAVPGAWNCDKCGKYVIDVQQQQ